jgi:hypothetical protein
MQLHSGAEHFGNVIFQYSELTSKCQAWQSLEYCWKVDTIFYIRNAHSYTHNVQCNTHTVFHVPVLIHFLSFPLDNGGGGDKGPTPILRHLYDLNIHSFVTFPRYNAHV